MDVDERSDNDGPIEVDDTLQTYNTEYKITEFINDVIETALYHMNKENIMILWGDDFTFMNAHQQYGNLEAAIKLANKLNTQNMEFIMSTPQAYVNAVKKEDI